MKQPVRSRKWWWLLPFLALLVIAGLVAARRNVARQGLPTAVVQHGSLRIEVATVGELEAVRSRTLHVPRLKSTTIKLVHLIPEGTTVAAGDTVARFDTTDVIRRLEDLESRLLSARANLEKLVATQAARMSELEASLEDQKAAVRLAELNASNVSYEARVDQEKAELSLKRARLNLQQLEAKIGAQRTIDQAELTEQRVNIASFESRLQSEREALENHVIVAPTAGLVVYGTKWISGRRTKIKLGDDLHYGGVVVELPDLTEMSVSSYVNEARVNQLLLGQSCEIRIDAFPDTLYTGEVAQINVLGRDLADAPGVKVFDFSVTIEGRDTRLRPGMTANIRVHVDELQDVIYAPIEVVHADEDGFFAYRRQGTAFERVAITPGRQNDFHVVIKSGLAPGEEVALRPPDEDDHER